MEHLFTHPEVAVIVIFGATIQVTNTWTVTITYTDVNGCTATVNRNLSLILPSSPERAACDLAAHSQNIIGWMMRMVGILGLLVVLHRQGVARTITIPTGSFIVNMGVTPQTVAGNFSASGEQHDLAHNYHVPINKSNRLAEAAISNRENPASNHTKQDIGLTGHTKQFGEL